MIRRVQAVRFDQLAEGGRNLPLRIAVDIDGEEVDAFLKPSGWREINIEAMANEVFAALIAGHMSLPICEPLLVELLPEWIETIQDTSLREALERSCPVAFGSRSAGTGWRKWTADDILPASLRSTALGIFAFDAFTENADRQAGHNPNLLIKSDELRIIDHEMAFRLRLALFPPLPTPWLAGNLSRMINAPGHALSTRLRRLRDVDCSDLRPSWVGLTDDALSDYASQLPTEWQDASDYVQHAVEHLAMVRDRIDDCLNEVNRVLS